jgi:excisionase family DNA binding protein
MEKPTLTPESKENNVILNSPAPLAYTLAEAAIRLRKSQKTVRRHIDRGDLRRCRKSGRVLIPRKDVDNFFERNSSYSFAV